MLESPETWIHNPESRLPKMLHKWACHYLVEEKKRGLALDPVANFHVRNGAEVYRVHWLADESTKRMEQSYGMMVNYIYLLDHLEANNEGYLLHGNVPSHPLLFDSFSK